MTLTDSAGGSSDNRSDPRRRRPAAGHVRSGRTRRLEWRTGQLRALERMLAEREKDFVAALAGPRP